MEFYPTVTFSCEFRSELWNLTISVEITSLLGHKGTEAENPGFFLLFQKFLSCNVPGVSAYFNKNPFLTQVFEEATNQVRTFNEEIEADTPDQHRRAVITKRDQSNSSQSQKTQWLERTIATEIQKAHA